MNLRFIFSFVEFSERDKLMKSSVIGKVVYWCEDYLFDLCSFLVD